MTDSARTTTRSGSAEIVRLIDVVRTEPEAFRRLDGCVAELRAVQAAKAALAGYSPAELLAALAGTRRVGQAGGAS